MAYDRILICKEGLKDEGVLEFFCRYQELKAEHESSLLPWWGEIRARI